MKEKLIILSGGFDPVHKGHIRMFEASKKIGKVAVGVNSDAWLMRKKNNIFMSFDERKEILESIKYIDYVFKFNDDDETACNLIELICKKYKEDYSIFYGNGGDRTKQNTPEIEYCTKNNIELIWGLGGGKIQSSSTLLKDWSK